MSQTTEPMRSPATSTAPVQGTTDALTFRRCGALPYADGSVLFRLWAPAAEQVELVLIDRDGRRTARRMTRADQEHHRYFEHVEPNVPDGQRYVYHLDGGPDRPD